MTSCGTWVAVPTLASQQTLLGSSSEQQRKAARPLGSSRPDPCSRPGEYLPPRQCRRHLRQRVARRWIQGAPNIRPSGAIDPAKGAGEWRGHQESIAVADMCGRTTLTLLSPLPPSSPLPVPLNRGAAVLARLPARQPSHLDRCALADQYGGGAGGLLEQPGSSRDGPSPRPRQQGES